MSQSTRRTSALGQDAITPSRRRAATTAEGIASERAVLAARRGRGASHATRRLADAPAADARAR